MSMLLKEWSNGPKKILELSHLEDHKIRFIVEDCLKFVKREQRRGRKYDGIIMDPPSYGRGPKKELWKLEDNLFELIDECQKLLSDDALFFLISCYTTGFSCSTLQETLQRTIQKTMVEPLRQVKTYFRFHITIPYSLVVFSDAGQNKHTIGRA